MKTAIDTLRAIVAWANNMDENFNDRVHNTTDWATLYCLSQHYKISHIEDNSLSELCEMGERKAVVAFAKMANSLLGYELYNVGAL